MREFRKKQKRLYKAMKSLIIIGVVFIAVYIGVKPSVAEISNLAVMICDYLGDALVVVSMALVFVYYSKYSKCDSFLNYVEHEISDCGYYLINDSFDSISSYLDTVVERIKNSAFLLQTDIELDELPFFCVGLRKKEFVYIAEIESANREDVLAYLDIVINDICVHNLKRAGNGVLCIVTDKAEESAIALSKMITPLGKKEQIKVAVAIAEPLSSKCYFLGNIPSKCQQMIAEYFLGCGLPVPDKLKGPEKLKFQTELEERMKGFNLKDYKNDSFYLH